MSNDPISDRIAMAIGLAADQLREEGYRQGFREADLDARRDLLLRQLRIKFLHLPKETLARVEFADRTAIDRWSQRVLTAETLDDAVCLTEGERLRSAGQQEGRAAGSSFGCREYLLEQLQLKFREIPDSVDSKIAKADIFLLIRWAEAVLEARSAEEVLAE